MRLFVVPKGTEVWVLEVGREWSWDSWRAHTTKAGQAFDLEQVIVDPSGISKIACVPGCVTVGSRWAEMGYYGFARDGWNVMVPWPSVTVL